jgi:hypothetical protein
LHVAPERLLLKNEVDGGARGYYNAESQASFGGMEAVYRAIKKTASSYCLEDAWNGYGTWLNEKHSYTLPYFT